MSRLMTPQLEEAFKDAPLYSQDGKGKDAICNAVFALGAIRWYMTEGEREGKDFTMFGIVVGLLEDEYGYVSLNELSGIELDLTSKGLGKHQVVQLTSFEPKPLKEIDDIRLRQLLARFEN